LSSFVCLSAFLSVSLERSAGMPKHARKPCPSGMPEGRAPKGHRRGHCGRRPPGGALGGGGSRAVTPTKKIIPQFFFQKHFTPWDHCGRTGVLQGGGKEGSPPQTKFPPKCFFHEIFPEGVTAAAGRQGVLKGGGKEGWGEGGVNKPPIMCFP